MENVINCSVTAQGLKLWIQLKLPHIWILTIVINETWQWLHDTSYLYYWSWCYILYKNQTLPQPGNLTKTITSENWWLFDWYSSHWSTSCSSDSAFNQLLSSSAGSWIQIVFLIGRNRKGIVSFLKSKENKNQKKSPSTHPRGGRAVYSSASIPSRAPIAHHFIYGPFTSLNPKQSMKNI